MVSKRKKINIVATLGLLAASVVATIGLLGNGSETSYVPLHSDNKQIQLTNSDAPTTSTEVVEEVTKAYGDSTSFVYKNVSYASDALCVLAPNGSIEKTDAAYNLLTVAASFATYNGGTMLFYQVKANEADEYVTSYPMDSNKTYTITGNYIRFVAPMGIKVTSITMTFGCLNPVEGNAITYRYVDRASSSAAWSYYQGTTSSVMATVNKNGAFNMAAADTDQSHWRVKDARKVVVETPTGGMNIAPKCASSGVMESDGSTNSGRSSCFVFPFRMNSNASVELNIRMAKYEAIALNGGQISCWVSLDGQYLKCPSVTFGHTDTNLYYNFKDCIYGTFALDKGNHVVVMEFFSNNVPTVDVCQLNVTNYGIDPVPYLNIRDNGDHTLEVEDLLAPVYGLKKYDSAWIGANGNRNNPLEGSTTLSTAGVSLGSQFKVTVLMAAPGDITLSGYFAWGASVDLKAATELFIDGVHQPKTQFDEYTIPSGKGWTDFVEFGMGTYHLDEGYHEITFSNVLAYNIDKYTLTVSNLVFSLFTLTDDGTTHLEAEDVRIDRSNWAIRSDWKAAGKSITENWNNSGATALPETSGVSLCGLDTNCEILLPFTVDADCDFEFVIYCACNQAEQVSNAYTVTIDGVALANPDTTVQSGSSSVSTYWNWKHYSAGTASLTAGLHSLVVTLNRNYFNLDSYDFIITNYQ